MVQVPVYNSLFSLLHSSSASLQQHLKSAASLGSELWCWISPFFLLTKGFTAAPYLNSELAIAVG